MASVTRKGTFGHFGHSVDQVSPYTILKTATRNPIAYTARNICAIDVTSVKKCRL